MRKPSLHQIQGDSSFVVARNPDPDSTLGYLSRLPLPDSPLVLKAVDIWPRTTKVYCHRADGWPESPQIIETVPVRRLLLRLTSRDRIHREIARIW